MLEQFRSSTKLRQITAGILFVLAASIFVFGIIHASRALDPTSRAIAACAASGKDEITRIDCWYDVVRAAFDTGGTEVAFEVFQRIYEEYPDFANTGCHRHAHRVGDMAYYLDYLTHKDLTQMNFPKNASTCGYGFYHGFFEHLVQDIPDVEFVTSVCELVTTTIFKNAPAISQTCYHGSGHGFVLAMTDGAVDPSTWSIEKFTEEPLAFCEALPRATAQEIGECRQGVFNVLADWMADEEFGLSYNTERPFFLCERQPEERQIDCFYEMAQKLDSVSNFNIANVITIADQVDDIRAKNVVVGVAIAGMVQHDPTDMQRDIFEACREHPDFLDPCIRSIVAGLVEHGVTGEYTVPVAFCAQGDLSEDERDSCHHALRDALKRFETDEDIMNFCRTGVVTSEFCTYLQSL